MHQSAQCHTDRVRRASFRSQRSGPWVLQIHRWRFPEEDGGSWSIGQSRSGHRRHRLQQRTGQTGRWHHDRGYVPQTRLHIIAYGRRRQDDSDRTRILRHTVHSGPDTPAHRCIGERQGAHHRRSGSTSAPYGHTLDRQAVLSRQQSSWRAAHRRHPRHRSDGHGRAPPQGSDLVRQQESRGRGFGAVQSIGFQRRQEGYGRSQKISRRQIRCGSVHQASRRHHPNGSISERPSVVHSSP